MREASTLASCMDQTKQRICIQKDTSTHDTASNNSQSEFEDTFLGSQLSSSSLEAPMRDTAFNNSQSEFEDTF